MIDALVERIAQRIDTPAVPVPAAIQAEVDALWRDRLATIDLAAARAQFAADGELLVVPELVAEPYVTRVLAEIDAARARRARVPLVRAAQHVGWRTLKRVSPRAAALYRSRVFLDWTSALVGKPMQLKDEADDHACATYDYTRAGDHMAPHYDTCGCEDGASYTQLLSLCDRSNQRLVVELHTKDGRPIERRQLRTPPGTLVVFCGSKVLHSVTPLGAGERRVQLSMSYASDPTMKPWLRLYENVKDALLYFGPTALVRGLWSRPRP
jgi:hypothetical protein